MQTDSEPSPGPPPRIDAVATPGGGLIGMTFCPGMLCTTCQADGGLSNKNGIESFLLLFFKKEGLLF